MSDLFGSIYRMQQGSSGGGATQNPRQIMLNTLGEQIVMDWQQKAVMDGAVFHIRAGTVTTPLVGDAPLADTAAEMAVDAASGTTIIPIHLNIGVRLGTGTLHEYAAKSVATASSWPSAMLAMAAAV